MKFRGSRYAKSKQQSVLMISSNRSKRVTIQIRNKSLFTRIHAHRPIRSRLIKSEQSMFSRNIFYRTAKREMLPVRGLIRVYRPFKVLDIPCLIKSARKAIDHA